jgi:DNA invertase Pin-like site-specific DNA recombinase/transposase
MIANAKITDAHRARGAYVYVRQSTEHQVQTHLQSQQRQYELADMAVSYGWPRAGVEVIDEDLGRSGSSSSGRSGFARLVADVALGKAGIVLGLEVSRLARNNRDWYQLLDLCSLTATLIGDADGVYDPASFNDRLLLGLKGTMSEAELHVLKGRMLAGLRHKASQGRLRFHLPPGYELDEEGRIVKARDEQVGHMLDLIFARVLEAGSVSGLLKGLQDERLLLPRKGSTDRAVRWVRPYYKALYDTLTNPIYTGAYVYGRTKIVKQLDAQGHARSRQKKQALESWDVLIHDHHPAYVSWEDFLRIRDMIRKNQPVALDQASRAVREGAALLQGLVRCGKCGRAMRVQYPGKAGGRHAYYVCRGAQDQGGPRCQSVGSRRVDEVVAAHFLEEMAPARMAVHLEALRRLHQEQDGTLTQLELDVERARYEADRKERQYHAVEPENRLVARSLERQWNEALERVRELEARIAERRRPQRAALREIDEREVERLAADLPEVWRAPSTAARDRKRLLHAAIDEVQIVKEGRLAHLKIIWKGGAVVAKSVALPKVPPKSRAGDLPPLVRQLAQRHTDAQIARVLIRKGLKTPTGLTFNAHRVASMRLQHGIECYRASNDRGAPTHTVDEAAARFGVHVATVYHWIRTGLLKADQVTTGAPWAVHITEHDLRRLSAADAPEGWLPLREAAVSLGVSRQSVVNWVKQGKVDYCYVTRGRRRGLRIDVSSVTCRLQPRLFS